jgi:hypothetical protein
MTRKIALAGRIAGQAAARHPYFRAGWAGVQVVAQVIARAVRQLWLEITGLFFLIFAVLGGFAAYREYPALESGEGSLGRLAVISLFTVMFLWFGLTSLWRARRKT